VRRAGKQVDVGLIAEALIYYDHVIVEAGSQPIFAEFVEWFVKQKRFDKLISLLEDDVLTIYDRAFHVNPLEHDGVYSIASFQDELEAEPNSFERRYLHHPSVTNVLSFSRQRQQLSRVLRDKVIEVKGSEFNLAKENADKDYADPHRSTLYLQALVDELYPILEWKEPPQVVATVVEIAHERHQLTWNLDFRQIKAALGEELRFHTATPLTAGAVSNVLLWSASKMSCDLYLGKPMSVLVGDKLYESQRRLTKTKGLIEELNVEVEFPDIRSLVNNGTLSVDDILEIRKKAVRFRAWLQQECDRDRNAILAYHFEVAKEAGLLRYGRKALHLFGAIDGIAWAAIAMEAAKARGVDVLTYTAAGAGIAKGLDFLGAIASKIGQDWRPIVFGTWLHDRIEKATRDQN
jgi:hypothetical protein